MQLAWVRSHLGRGFLGGEHCAVLCLGGESIFQESCQAGPQEKDCVGVFLVQLQVVHFLGHRLKAQNTLGSVVNNEPGGAEGQQPGQKQKRPS